MKNYKGAVFFDVDGTLVDERLEIFKPTSKTIESIQKLKENGYLVGIATGRARCYVPDMGIDFDCYVRWMDRKSLMIIFRKKNCCL